MFVNNSLLNFIIKKLALVTSTEEVLLLYVMRGQLGRYVIILCPRFHLHPYLSIDYDNRLARELSQYCLSGRVI